MLTCKLCFKLTIILLWGEEFIRTWLHTEIELSPSNYHGRPRELPKGAHCAEHTGKPCEDKSLRKSRAACSLCELESAEWMPQTLACVRSPVSTIRCTAAETEHKHGSHNAQSQP